MSTALLKNENALMDLEGSIKTLGIKFEDFDEAIANTTDLTKLLDDGANIDIKSFVDKIV
jgi:hypothetical protein